MLDLIITISLLLILITGLYLWYLGTVMHLNHKNAKVQNDILKQNQHDLGHLPDNDENKIKVSTQDYSDYKEYCTISQFKDVLSEDNHLYEVEFEEVPIYQTPEMYPIWLVGKNTTDCVIGTTERSDKGLLEDFFFGFLLEKFGTNVMTDLCITVDKSKIIPDFCLYNESKQLKVVIEIDEPYSIGAENAFVPIHVKGVDDRRNQLLLSTGWNIIRFAEEQIALFTENCCDAIQLILNGETPLTPKISCWTQEESLEMIRTNYRNSYLPLDFTGQIKKNIDISFLSLPISFITTKISKKNEDYFVIYYNVVKSNSVLSLIRETWIQKDLFYEVIKDTKSHQLISTKKSFKKEGLILMANLGLKGARIQGPGEIKPPYFNLLPGSNIKIIDTDESLKNTDKLMKILESNDPWKILILLEEAKL
jgi:very-short-patch-repair endonuclease